MKAAGGKARPFAAEPKKLPLVQVEFMPGRVVEMPAYVVSNVSRYVICKLKKQADGKYALIPQNWGQQMKLTTKTPRLLGLPCGYKVLKHLMACGFIEGVRVSPHLTWVDPLSILAHFERCKIREGEPSWWTPERIAAYSDADLESRLPRVDKAEQAKRMARKGRKVAQSTREGGTQAEFGF